MVVDADGSTSTWWTAGLTGAFGILAATMPLLRRLTGLEAARNE